MGEGLAAKLRSHGAKCCLAYPGESYELLSPDSWHLDPTNPGHFQQLLQETTARLSGSVQGIVHLWNLELPQLQESRVESLESGQRIGVGSALYLVQAMARDPEAAQESTKLWFVTRNAQFIDQADALQTSQSPIWGMAKVISLEYPEWHCNCVDMDGGQTIESQAQDLFEEVWNMKDNEDQIAYRRTNAACCTINSI